MHKLYFSAFFCLALSFISFAQVPLSYYLPQQVSYDSKIPTPEQFLGFQIGEQHVTTTRLQLT